MAADKKTLQRDVLKQVQAGKLDKAVETYRAIIKLDGKDAAVRNSLADLLGKLGKRKEAVAEYMEASALYEKDGFGPRAIAVCQKVVKLDPEQWGVRLKLGDLYAAQKLRAEARAIFAQLADRHDKRGEVASALDMFRRIADLEPENLPVRVKLAGMFEKQKQGEKAAEEYVRAAKGYAARKEKDAAAQLLVRAFKLCPANAEARRLLADVYAQRQEWSVVVGLLETPVKRGAQDVDLIVLYAEALTRVNHAREAEALLEKLQGRDPNSVPVNLALGRACLKAGDLEKGAAALNRCVGAHIAENRLELAESLLRELEAAAPEDDRVLQRIIEVAQKRGNAASAAETYLKLAAVYESKGLTRNAVGALERYLENRPGDAAAAERLERLKGALAPPTPPAEAAAPAPAPKPAVAAKAPAAPAPASAAKAKVPPAPEVELEIDLEETEDLTQFVAAGEEEELVVEGEEGIPEVAPEPTSVAEARTGIARGAAAAAAAFLEDHLGANPGDVDGWEALAEARRALGSPKAARDALLRLADVHRRARRFEEARGAYKGALDLDHRSAAAARGLAALIIEEEEAHAEAPAAPVAPAPPAPGPPPAAEPAGIEQPLAAAEEGLIDISFEEESVPPAPEPVAAPEQAYGEISLEAAVPVEAPPVPAGDFGEIALEELPESPEAAGSQSVIAEPAAEPPVVVSPAEFAEISLEEPPAEAGADEISLEGFEEELVEAVAADGAQAEPAPMKGIPEPVPEPMGTALAQGPETIPEPILETAGEATPHPSVEPLPEPIPEPIPEPAVEATPHPSVEPVAEAIPEPVLEPAFEAPPPTAAAPTAEAAGAPQADASLAEADFYLQQGLLAEAEALFARLAPESPAAAAKLQAVREQRAAAEPQPVAAAEPAPAALSDAGADFGDFLGDLRLELEGQGDFAPPAPLDEAGLNEIFQEFQRSVKEQLGDEDFETHYNLGIAYKEMGLTEEAIGEFSLAEKSPSRSMDAVSMIALCLREQGRVDEAVQKLRTGVALAVEGSEQQKGFLYDLAALHEQSGRADLAGEALQRLHAIDPAYRDVAARLGAAPPQAEGRPRKKPKVSYL